MDRLQQIRQRQTARLLAHLERTGKLTPELRADILRSFGYTFDDLTQALQAEAGARNQHGGGKDDRTGQERD